VKFLINAKKIKWKKEHFAIFSGFFGEKIAIFRKKFATFSLGF